MKWCFCQCLSSFDHKHSGSRDLLIAHTHFHTLRTIHTSPNGKVLLPFFVVIYTIHTYDHHSVFLVFYFIFHIHNTEKSRKRKKKPANDYHLQTMQQYTTTPQCIWLHVGVSWLNSRRSSWLKGTKPHRNTWLGSVWPATARRVASAARGRARGKAEGRLRVHAVRESDRKQGERWKWEERKKERSWTSSASWWAFMSFPLLPGTQKVTHRIYLLSQHSVTTLENNLYIII